MSLVPLSEQWPLVDMVGWRHVPLYREQQSRRRALDCSVLAKNHNGSSLPVSMKHPCAIEPPNNNNERACCGSSHRMVLVPLNDQACMAVQRQPSSENHSAEICASPNFRCNLASPPSLAPSFLFTLHVTRPLSDRILCSRTRDGMRAKDRYRRAKQVVSSNLCC